MDRSIAWRLGILFGMAVAGALVGATYVRTGRFREAHLAGLLFAAVFLGCGLALQMYRRGLPHAVPVGSLGAGLAVFGFFSVPIGLAWGQGLDRVAILLFLGLLPAIAAASAALGTAYLARGVDRYRAIHGLVHAPR